AYARHAWAVATSTASSSATDGVAVVEAIAQRPGDRYRFPRALLELDLGGVAMAHGDRTTARTRFERARRSAAGLTEGASELTAVDVNLLLVVDDPALHARIGAELIATRTRLLGAHHPLTLAARRFVANLELDPHVAGRALAAACRDLADYHPTLTTERAECGYDLWWLAIGSGDAALATQASQVVLGAKADGDDPKFRTIVRAYEEAIHGDLAAARATLAAPELAFDPSAPWWVQLYTTDALAVGLVTVRGEPAQADAQLAEVERRYAAVASSLPSSIRTRRAAAIAKLRGR
ncbi:MAG: hypothetical protein H0T79_03805, partial [Deltaproteobacteria bacterium]|nr:hypothetical protein [Deltaproteobacteria bacterium]